MQQAATGAMILRLASRASGSDMRRGLSASRASSARRGRCKRMAIKVFRDYPATAK